jgi:hypothetical protein
MVGVSAPPLCYPPFIVLPEVAEFCHLCRLQVIAITFPGILRLATDFAKPLHRSQTLSQDFEKVGNPETNY